MNAITPIIEPAASAMPMLSTVGQLTTGNAGHESTLWTGFTCYATQLPPRRIWGALLRFCGTDRRPER